MATKKKNSSKPTPGEERFVATGKGIVLLNDNRKKDKAPAKKKGGK